MSESNAPNRPLISVALSPRPHSDLWKLQRALSDLAQQDPAMKIETEPGDGSSIIGGMSHLHLETICARIVQEYKIQLDVGAPQIIYLETIRKCAEAEGRYIRQTGGGRNYAHVALRLEPIEPGSGYQFVDETIEGTIPPEFVEAVKFGIQSTLKGGVLAGYEMVNVRAVLYDGSYHVTDSNEIAFQIAASIAFKEAARKADPVMLEPMMSVEVVFPEEYMGAIIADLNKRRGRIEDLEQRGHSQVLRAIVPLAELFAYRQYIHANTQGKASHSMHFVRYEPVPRRDGPDDYEAGVMANKPKSPRAGNNLAAARLDAGFE